MTITAVQVLATPDEELEADVAGSAPVELTVAFTDLEDFTTYTQANGDDAARRLLIGHHRESERIVRGRGGRVLKPTGDGLMLSFPAPEAAVLACLGRDSAAAIAGRHPRRQGAGDSRRRRRRSCGEPGGASHRVRWRGRTGRH